VKRHYRLLMVQLRASIQVAMQYRADFIVGGFMALFWMFWNLVPVFVLFGRRPSVAGWTFPEALLVVAWFNLLRGLLDGAVQPSLIAVVEHIRKGTLDFVLLKPVDAQFLVSTQKFEPWRVFDGATAVAIGVYAFVKIGRAPGASDLAAALLLTVSSALILYALAILTVSAAFFVVRLDNLIYLFNSIFDAGRWPATVFRGVWRFVFTWIVPLALMTTYPALAVLGKLSWGTTGLAFGGALVFVLMARLVWLRAIAHYTSASS
jgi:ABC-2 type transport system permease protein